MKRRDIVRYTITGVFLFAAAGTAFDDQMLITMIFTGAAALAFFAKKKIPTRRQAKVGIQMDNSLSRAHYSTSNIPYGRES